MKKSRESQQSLKEARGIFKLLPHIRIEGPFEEEPNIARNVFNQPSMDIKNFTDITYALEVFGDLINYLEVDFKHISAVEGKEIVKRINDHCSALTSLKLDNCHGNVLDNLNSEFPTISSVSFSSHRTENMTIKADNKKFRELFPNLFFFTIGNVKGLNEWSYIGGTYKKIPFIELKDQLNNDDKDHFIEFLKQNLHLMGVRIHSADNKLLYRIYKAFLNLTFIQIDGLAIDYSNNDPFYIDNLKQFKFISKSRDHVPNGFVLTNVEQLSLEIPFIFNKDWMNFLETKVNRGLKKLHVKTNNLKKVQLLKIATLFKSLQEVHIEVKSRFGVEEIIEFLNSFENNKLARLTLEADLHESDAIELTQLLEEWEAVYTNENSKTIITIEKLI